MLVQKSTNGSGQECRERANNVGLDYINKGKDQYQIEMFSGTGEGRPFEAQFENKKKIEKYTYDLDGKLGNGNFSQVFRGVDTQTGLPVAVKVVKYSSLVKQIAQQLLINEVNIIQELSHQNVLKVRDIFKSKNNYYIITDLYEGGDLEKLIFRHKFLQEKDIGRLIYQIYKGLLYLNECNIVHRDFKPANIFIDANGTPKIADFGFSVKSDKPFQDMSIGSPIYMSPQGLIRRQYGPKTQVWGFGIVLYEMLHGYTPLSRCKTQQQLKQKILLPPSFREGISQQLKRLINLCLTVDPQYRIDMKSIANTPYMSWLIKQFQGKSNKDLTSTSHTQTLSSSKNMAQFVKQIKHYEQALALLHYCRLIHKTSMQSPSAILSQSLLVICRSLTQVKIQGGNWEQNQTLIKTIHDYSVKYHHEHIDRHIEISFNDIINQCVAIGEAIKIRINSSNSKNKLINFLMLIIKETELLKICVESNKISVYAKSTQIQKELESSKSNNLNTVTFNK